MKSVIGGKASTEDPLQEFRDFNNQHKIPTKAMSHKEGTSSGKDGREIALEKSEVSASKTSISACSCGPECGPDKCDGRNRSVLVGWDSLRTKIFIFLFIAFMVWLVIYVPISLTILGN